MRKNCLKYPVEVVEDVFGASSALADALRAAVAEGTSPRVLLVADYNVVQHTSGLGTKIGRYLADHGLTAAGKSVVLPGGEKAKTDGLQEVRRVLEAAAAARPGPDVCLVAIGGGSVLDVAGYAASQLAGGVRLVRVPTTPAALFDAAFAGRARLDFGGVKDALCVASEPAAVLLDPTFAQTVLDGVWRGGFGEVVRLAAVGDRRLFAAAERLAASYRAREPSALAELVSLALEAHRRGVATDFARAAAAEMQERSGFKLPYGYAVSMAVAVEGAYAALRGLQPQEDADRMRQVLAVGGALDGLGHSQYLLGAAESLADACLVRRRGAADLPGGIGVGVIDDAPDRSLYLQALNVIKYTP